MNFHKILWPILTLCLLGGCTSYKKKFHNKTIANIGYFTDNTITMLSDLDLRIKQEDTLLVRRFINLSAPEEKQLSALNDDLERGLENIVRYSIEIVNIAESDTTEIHKVQLYADYLVTFRESIVATKKVDLDLFKNTIEQVREQTEFIEALRKAQPLLNAAIMAGALQINTLTQTIEILSQKVDTRIEIEYADIIRYRTKLDHEKSALLSAFETLYEAYQNTPPDLTKLRKSGVFRNPEILPKERPSHKDLQKIAAHLEERMEKLLWMQKAIQPNWNDYLATHQELDKLTDKTIRSAHHTRIILLIWMRTHQNMVAGKMADAEWFDLGETTKQLIKNAPNAIL